MRDRLMLISTVALALSASAASAEVVLDFESSGYDDDRSILGRRDEAANAKWAAPSGFGSAVNAGTTKPRSGRRAASIRDGATNTAYGATLPLPSDAVDFARPFTLTFSWALGDVSKGTDHQAQFYFGEGRVSGSGNHWAHVDYHNGELRVYVGDASGAHKPAAIGAYDRFSPMGEYVTISLTIDPQTRRYTSVRVTGATGDATDVTAKVQAVNDGVLPLRTGQDPPVSPHVMFVTGVNDTLAAEVDDILLQQASDAPASP